MHAAAKENVSPVYTVFSKHTPLREHSNSPLQYSELMVLAQPDASSIRTIPSKSRNDQHYLEVRPPIAMPLSAELSWYFALGTPESQT